MKIKLKSIIDGIFAFILFFLLYSAIGRRFAGGTELTLAVLILTVLTLSVYLKSSELSFVKNNDIEMMQNAFIFTPIPIADFFAAAFSKRYKTEKVGDMLIVGKTTVAFCLSTSPLSYGALANIFRNKKTDRLLILCFFADKQSKRLASRMPQKTEIWEKDEVYKFLKTFNSLPSTDFSFDKKTSVKSLIKTATSPRLSRAYVFSAIIILAFSSFTPFYGYYTVFAIITLLIAVVPPLVKAIVK